MQLDKALRDFLAQMRSPSPEPTTDSPSDPGKPPATSGPSPPAQSRYKAVTTARAPRAEQPSGADRKGQTEANVRPPDHTGPRLHSPPLAAKLPVNQGPVTPVGSGMGNQVSSHAQAEHTSAEPVAAASRQTHTRQDAAQQTVSSLEGTASHMQDACVQSELPMVPNHSHQVPITVPTDERATQTPVGHASPRPLQRAPPGRDAPWSPRYAAQNFEVQSPAQAHRDSLRHERPGPPQGSWAQRQSPSPRWPAAGIDPLPAQDSMAAHGDALTMSTSAVPAALSLHPSQRTPGYSQHPAQRLFGSPPPDVDPLQLAMQPQQHLPAFPSGMPTAQQQDSHGHRSAEPALPAVPLHEGGQEADHPPAGSSNPPAEISGPSAPGAPAGVAQGPAPHSVAPATPSSSQPTSAERSPAWLGTTPAGAPNMAGPSLQFRAAAPSHAGHWPSSVAQVAQQQSALPGDGYAYRQPQSLSAHQAGLHASARAMSRGFGTEGRAAPTSVPANVVQQHPFLPGMYGLPSRVYAGASSSKQLGAVKNVGSPGDLFIGSNK